MGIGFTLIVDRETVDAVRGQLAELKMTSWIIGDVVPGDRGVELL